MSCPKKIIFSLDSEVCSYLGVLILHCYYKISKAKYFKKKRGLFGLMIHVAIKSKQHHIAFHEIALAASQCCRETEGELTQHRGAMCVNKDMRE